MKKSLFPYKELKAEELEDGILFNVPEFCKKRIKSKECISFYESLNKNDGIKKCPCGFGSQLMSIGNEDFILTCLNIEKVTNRKVNKYVKSDEFLPRLTQNKYNQLIEEFQSIMLDVFSLEENKNDIENQVNIISKEKELLENTLHEIRKLNNELKSCIESFSVETENLIAQGHNISTLTTDIYSISNLLSIRFDSYDFEVNPTLNANAIKTNIPIYRRIEKVYKCLQRRIRNKLLRLHMQGNSYNYYYASNILEIGFFIIIDNAIKYSPESEEIRIKFTEVEDNLKISFINFGIRPDESELSKLTQRGYRCKKIQNINIYDGRGIGLYLLKCICDYCNVSLSFKIGNENKYIDGYRYSPFIVELEFKNMIIVNNNL